MATQPPRRRRLLIAGAAGRDFHDFNVVFRDDASVEVVAFTAAQIPGIAGRRYPASLAGALYPEGIPIEDESRLDELCRGQRIDEVVFAYSDVSHAHVMHLASQVLAAGADFSLLGPQRTQLRSHRPVIAVSAVRTGCGKSQTARHIGKRLRSHGLAVAVLRHPMPYGELAAERVQRFATRADLDAARCTLEEREEYEPHLENEHVVFAGVDYAAILAAAEREAQVIVWDGGNNDFPLVTPDLHVVLTDALRPDQLATHHPGEAVLRMADVLVIAKSDAAPPADVARLAATLAELRPGIPVVRAASPVVLTESERVRGRRVMVVDDGPTLTHGGAAFGAGFVAARGASPAEIVDPRESATDAIRAVYARYPHIGCVLPAVGYDEQQRQALAETIARSRAELVVSGTPIDLAQVIHVPQPVLRARYEYADAGEPTLGSFVDAFLQRERARLHPFP